MKNKFFLIIFFLLLCSITTKAQITKYSIATVGYSGYSIDVSNTGTPYIAYINSTSKTVKLAKWNAGSFIHETIDTGKVLTNCALKLDNSGNPGVAYLTGPFADPDRLLYAHWNGSAWQKDTIDFHGSGIGVCDIKYDNTNTPYVLYTKYGSAWELYLAKLNGQNWTIQQIDTAKGHSGTLEIESNNNIHIAYYDQVNVDVIYAKYNGTTWSKEVVSTNATATPPQISLTTDNKPVIGYVNGTSLRFIKWSGTAWNETTVRSVYTGTGVSMDLSSNNNPQFSAYYSYSVNQISWTGSTYTETSIESLVNSTEYISKLKVDGSDNFHILYYKDATLKYATSANLGTFVSDIPVLNQIQIYPNPTSDYAMINFLSPSSKTINLKIVNFLGEIVYTSEIEILQGENSFKLPLENIKKGIYFCVLVSKESTETQKFIIK